jgi:hypothetical protein
MRRLELRNQIGSAAPERDQYEMHGDVEQIDESSDSVRGPAPGRPDAAASLRAGEIEVCGWRYLPPETFLTDSRRWRNGRFDLVILMQVVGALERRRQQRVDMRTRWQYLGVFTVRATDEGLELRRDFDTKTVPHDNIVGVYPDVAAQYVDICFRTDWPWRLVSSELRDLLAILQGCAPPAS